MIEIKKHHFLSMVDSLEKQIDFERYDGIFPVLRGGYHLGVELSRRSGLPLVSEVGLGTLVVDDLADSGATIAGYQKNDTAVLIVKNSLVNSVTYYATEECSGWISFFWEKPDDVESIIVRQLQAIGEDSSRAGLIDTPARVVKMWKEIFRGYDETQKPKVTTFENGGDGITADQMIIDSGDYYSHCEHHMVPFFGKYWFGYIPHPEGLILGLSKVARVVDYYSARLQVQERLTSQIIDCLWEALSDCEKKPLGMILIVEGEHLCKTMRGVKKKGKMKSSALKGLFEKQKVRNEFLQLIK
jgi:GTP cyclohydrolase I